jgi:hypothetical protein
MSNQRIVLASTTNENGRVQAVVLPDEDQNLITADASTAETNSIDRPGNPQDRATTELHPVLSQPVRSVPHVLQHQPVAQAPIMLTQQTLYHLALSQLMNVAAVPNTIAAQNQHFFPQPPSNHAAGSVMASQFPLFYAAQNQLFSAQLPSNLAGPAVMASQNQALYATAGMHTNPIAVANMPTTASLLAPPPQRTTVSLHMPMDEESLSTYQCLLRKQIELFEATQEDLKATAQGRNKPIILNQVGIRCRHCARLRMGERAKGSVYFPSQLMGLYQTAQNMTKTHLMKDCAEVPRHIREDLVRLRERKKGGKSHVGGGREYWAEGLRVLGVYETEDRRLRFRKTER